MALRLVLATLATAFVGCSDRTPRMADAESHLLEALQAQALTAAKEYPSPVDATPVGLYDDGKLTAAFWGYIDVRRMTGSADHVGSDAGNTFACERAAMSLRETDPSSRYVCAPIR
jgi:hypothetical protein